MVSVENEHYYEGRRGSEEQHGIEVAKCDCLFDVWAPGAGEVRAARKLGRAQATGVC